MNATLLIGLGNPGIEYERTRHNAGWLFLNFLHDFPDAEFEPWKEKKKLNALVSEGLWKEKKIVLAKPTMFMNLSGLAVNQLVSNYGLRITDYPERLLVAHDDTDIPFGEYKIQKNRGAAGHHGIESIMEHLNTKEFMRIRIGIRPTPEWETPGTKAGTFVLKNFSAPEEFQLPVIFQKIVYALRLEIQKRKTPL